jgi:hypothetical protein
VKAYIIEKSHVRFPIPIPQIGGVVSVGWNGEIEPQFCMFDKKREVGDSLEDGNATCTRSSAIAPSLSSEIASRSLRKQMSVQSVISASEQSVMASVSERLKHWSEVTAQATATPTSIIDPTSPDSPDCKACTLSVANNRCRVPYPQCVLGACAANHNCKKCQADCGKLVNDKVSNIFR